MLLPVKHFIVMSTGQMFAEFPASLKRCPECEIRLLNGFCQVCGWPFEDQPEKGVSSETVSDLKK